MAKFNIDVLIDPAGAVRGAARVRRELDGTNDSVDRLRRNVGMLGAALGALGAGALFIQAIQSASRFQGALAEVSTLVDTTVFDMGRLTAAAQANVAAYGGNTTQQAQAFYQAISAGASDAATAISLIDAANRLAIGGVTDVTTAVDGLTTITNAFGAEAGSATDISDALFVAMRAGKTTIGELSTAIGSVAPLAANTGVSLEEVLAATAALTKGGISTSVAMNGLRATLAAVAKPSAEASELAQQLGIDFSAAGLESQGFAAFMQEVAEKTGGSTEQLAILFGGVEALVPVMSLAGAQAEDFASILDQMGMKAGATEDAFNKVANSPGFQWGRLVGAISVELERLAMIITTAAVPVMKFLADNMSTIADLFYVAAAAAIAFGVSLAIGQLNTYIQTLFALQRALGAATAGQALLGIAMTGFSGILGVVTTAFRVLTVAIMANPIGFLIVALTTVIALLYQFGGEIELGGGRLATLGDLGKAAWEKISAGLSALWDLFKQVFGSLAELAGAPFEYIAEVARAVFGDVDVSITGLITVVARVIDFVIGAFTGAFRAIVGAWELIPAALKDIMIRAMNGVVSIVEAGVNKAISALNTIPGIDIGAAALGRIENDAAGAAGRVGEVVAEAFQSGFDNSPALDAATGLLDRADEIARERLNTPEAPGGPADPVTTPTVPGTGAGVGTGAGTGGAAAGGGGGAASATFDELLGKLQQENELLQLNNQERLVRQQILSMEDQLKRQLTSTETEAVRQAVLMNEQLKVQDSILQELRGPAEQNRMTQEALNTLYADGRITLQEYTAAMRDLAVASTETANTMQGGLANGLARVAQEANNLGKGVSDWVVGAFSSATDAIVEFAKTGEFNVRQFFQDLFAQLLKLATNQLFASILGSFGGGSALGGGGGLFSGLGSLLGFATGGDMIVGGSGGTDSQLVAFKATPNERISVRTPGQSMPGDGAAAPAAPPQVNIKNINVTDPREALNALNTAEGERTILNTIKRNPGAFKRILGAN